MGLADEPAAVAGEDGVPPARVEREPPKAPSAWRDHVAVVLVVVGAPLAMLAWLTGIIWVLTRLF
jgi:hypothetical protein